MADHLDKFEVPPRRDLNLNINLPDLNSITPLPVKKEKPLNASSTLKEKYQASIETLANQERQQIRKEEELNTPKPLPADVAKALSPNVTKEKSAMAEPKPAIPEVKTSIFGSEPLRRIPISSEPLTQEQYGRLIKSGVRLSNLPRPQFEESSQSQSVVEKMKNKISVLMSKIKPTKSSETKVQPLLVPEPVNPIEPIPQNKPTITSPEETKSGPEISTETISPEGKKVEKIPTQRLDNKLLQDLGINLSKIAVTMNESGRENAFMRFENNLIFFKLEKGKKEPTSYKSITPITTTGTFSIKDASPIIRRDILNEEQIKTISDSLWEKK